MEDDVDSNDGLSRRNLIKRGAIVGGTAVWLTPVVQTFTQPAFGLEPGSPAPEEPPGEPPLGKDFSYVVVVYTCGAGLANVKFEFNGNGDVVKCEDKADVNAPKCNTEVDGLGSRGPGRLQSLRCHDT